MFFAPGQPAGLQNTRAPLETAGASSTWRLERDKGRAHRRVLVVDVDQPLLFALECRRRGYITGLQRCRPDLDSPSIIVTGHDDAHSNITHDRHDTTRPQQ